MAYDMDSIGHSIDKLEDTISDAVISKSNRRSNNMNDIAGLLALDDFFTALIPELTTEEHAELVKFFKAVTPTV